MSLFVISEFLAAPGQHDRLRTALEGVCSQAHTSPDAACGNIICLWPPERRCFTRVDALAMYSGSLETELRRTRSRRSR